MVGGSFTNFRTQPIGYAPHDTAFGPVIARTPHPDSESIDPRLRLRKMPDMAVADVRNRFVEYEIVAHGYPTGPQGEKIAQAAGERFDDWLKQLLAETWDLGASDYYGKNPFGEIE